MPVSSMAFDSHLPNLLREIIEGNPNPGPLIRAANLTTPILAAVARRAIEIDDPELNILMLRLALYEVAPSERVAAIRAQQLRLSN